MRKTILLLAFILICFSSSCSTDDIAKCDFVDASQELLWLRNIIKDREENPTDHMKYCYISQGKLKSELVFILGDCNPKVNKVTFVLDCEGNAITDKDGNNIIVSEVDIKDRKTIWKPNDFACDLNGSTIN